MNILIVDDSFFMRRIMRDIILGYYSDAHIREAKNGSECLKYIDDNTDVIILDIEMPVMNGIETLKNIRGNNINIPVVMFSSLTREGSTKTAEALSLGAIDFIEKPNNTILTEEKKNEIISKITAAYNYKKRKKQSTLNDKIKLRTSKFQQNSPSIDMDKGVLKNIVLIGCSTGGPAALKQLLPEFPKDLNAAIFIVQHMPNGDFIRSLAKSLNNESQMAVTVPTNGQKILNGNIYIAPSGYQTHINSDGVTVIEKKGNISGHEPSVDYLFSKTLKSNVTFNLIPVVLTGMGSDGTTGSLLFSTKGIETIVESEETTSVFGMPKSVITSGSLHKKLKLNEIAEYIKTLPNEP